MHARDPRQHVPRPRSSGTLGVPSGAVSKPVIVRTEMKSVEKGLHHGRHTARPRRHVVAGRRAKMKATSQQPAPRPQGPACSVHAPVRCDASSNKTASSAWIGPSGIDNFTDCQCRWSARRAWLPATMQIPDASSSLSALRIPIIRKPAALARPARSDANCQQVAVPGQGAAGKETLRRFDLPFARCHPSGCSTRPRKAP
ncbi:uncharacterized protein BDZ99DRAFT_520148 [Mytilinidion resinicola]|uniref:Uncharacterized protein n=1 Tax=Mytilinidion resinicola TaxID=574789 RepID=A0A6A6YPV6_9PEZI|nr:uncharacterized protein BDZ99DRAFT_520148 [Mytilinidion resinicola]KAF2810054.1 hypothetical protein BDZ99DRAFT_520148 [Mytilinidion resinicola]